MADDHGCIDRIRKALIEEIGEPDEDEEPESDRDPDDFDPADAFGGNFDDAYEGGKQKGREEFARELLKLI